jgi:hypothetical protein
MQTFLCQRQRWGSGQTHRAAAVCTHAGTSASSPSRPSTQLRLQLLQLLQQQAAR